MVKPGASESTSRKSHSEVAAPKATCLETDSAIDTETDKSKALKDELDEVKAMIQSLEAKGTSSKRLTQLKEEKKTLMHQITNDKSLEEQEKALENAVSNMEDALQKAKEKAEQAESELETAATKANEAEAKVLSLSKELMERRSKLEVVRSQLTKQKVESIQGLSPFSAIKSACETVVVGTNLPNQSELDEITNAFMKMMSVLQQANQPTSPQHAEGSTEDVQTEPKKARTEIAPMEVSIDNEVLQQQVSVSTDEYMVESPRVQPTKDEASTPITTAQHRARDAKKQQKSRTRSRSRGENVEVLNSDDESKTQQSFLCDASIPKEPG